MTERFAETLAPRNARTAGLLYLVLIGSGVAAHFASQPMIVPQDAAATASNILASEPLFRFSIAANLVATTSYIGITAIFFVLFWPVSNTGSVLAAFFSLVGLAVSAGSAVNNVAPLAYLSGAHYLAAFTPDQLHALARMPLRLQAQGDNIALIFFGFYCVAIGCLIIRSAFLPRVLGLLMIVAGVGWVTDSFATILSPAFEARLSAYVPIAGIIGEGSLALWLLVMGVNIRKWQAPAMTPAA